MTIIYGKQATHATRPVAGFRKMTPAMVESQLLAGEGVTVLTTKSKVSIAAKKAAPSLGVDGVAFHILDILFGLARKEDFAQGSRPVVSVSNEKLANYIQRSDRTVSRALRRLCEVGLMAFCDSPAGKRFKHTRSGEAYGLDLSPAANRVTELEKLGEAFKEATQAKKRAQRSVTKLKRQIIDLEPPFAELGLDYSEIRKQLERVLEAAASYEDKAESLAMIYEHGCAQITMDDAEKDTQDTEVIDQDMSPLGDKFDAHLHNTNPQTKISCNRMRAISNEIDLEFTEEYERPTPNGVDFESTGNPAYSGLAELALDEKPLGELSQTQQAQEPVGGVLHGVSSGLLFSATAKTQETFGLPMSNWQDLAIQAEALRVCACLSVPNWKSAVAAIGLKAAAAVLLVAVEKSLRGHAGIKNTAGYFCACVARAKDGNLALSRSVWGLAQS